MYEAESDKDHLYVKLPNGSFARIMREDFEMAVKMSKLSDCPVCRRKP
jgi:hypothetical protein